MSFNETRVAEYQQKLKERDELLRESWVRSMEARIVRDSLQKCYRTEGVNHLESCKQLADKYLELIRENRVKGYKHIDV
ncbi:NADH-ubiquinone oxidoreductase 12 kDa subunit [Panus rudis PR-1116 ss-1]|nr:NADH-ubiquinone oxidoreductase 12 kDa subunit [Panus rudis PR-1116 ss-1]